MTTILMLTIIVMSAVILVTAGCALWLDRNDPAGWSEWGDRGVLFTRSSSRGRPPKARPG